MPITGNVLEFLIDGKQSLKAQQNQINFAEMAHKAQTLTYAAHTEASPVANRVVILQDGAPAKDLTLIAIDANPIAALTEVVNSGKIIIFHSTIFVNGKSTTVIGVR